VRVPAIPTLCIVAGLAVASCKDSEHRPPGMAEMQTPSPGPAPRDLGNREVWVTVRRDLAPCSTTPRCGWFARSVNEHDPGTHVDGIDLTRAGIAPGTPEAGVLDAPDGEVVIRGTRSPEGIFVATGVWRGLPGNTWFPGDVFVQIDPAGATACAGGPCGHEQTRELNIGIDITVPTVDFARATDPGVDAAWLEDRVYRRGAVVSGRFIMGEQARGVSKLQASEVFVPLPDRVGPCPESAMSCEPGTVAGYQRNPDRCLVAGECVTVHECPGNPPSCARGYVSRTWLSTRNACPAFACDPWFLPQ
jgi:hypothetical protein